MSTHTRATCEPPDQPMPGPIMRHLLAARFVVGAFFIGAAVILFVIGSWLRDMRATFDTFEWTLDGMTRGIWGRKRD